MDIEHRNLRLQSNFNFPKALLSQHCSDSTKLQDTDNSFISNLQLKAANFGGANNRSCYGSYEINMDVNNVLSFPIRFSYPNSQIGCAYLYRFSSIDGGSKAPKHMRDADLVLLGCGKYIQSEDLDKFESAHSVTLRIDKQQDITNEYVAFRNDIVSHKITENAWGIPESSIADGTTEDECVKLRAYGLSRLRSEWAVGIIAKTAVKFDNIYTMQADSIVYPPEGFLHVNEVENTTFSFQYATKSNKLESSLEKINLIDLDRWNQDDQAFGGFSFDNTLLYDDVFLLLGAIHIDGDVIFWIIFSASLGCMCTCWSICALVMKCKGCPRHRVALRQNKRYPKTYTNANAVPSGHPVSSTV
eukprot:g1475.t1